MCLSNVADVASPPFRPYFAPPRPNPSLPHRPDLQLAGRTIMGTPPARGQELSDHYMAPLNQAALRCMQEMQETAFKMGIPLNTRHREVAPNQVFPRTCA